MRRRPGRKKRLGETFSASNDAPRDLAKRLAEVQALRELVRMKEEELEKRSHTKKKDWSLKPPPARS